MKLVIAAYKSFRKIFRTIVHLVDWIRTRIVLYGNAVLFSSIRSNGFPYVIVANGAKGMRIGKNFAMNNGIKGNPIGCYERCTFFVDRDSEIIIGDNVGISQSALISYCSIHIGNNVKIGGGSVVYTSDFHSLNPETRASSEDLANRKVGCVIIEDNVFIGAKSIILKGVTIGSNSIVGAGSVVTKSIPPNQIWAGNPAKFIRNI